MNLTDEELLERAEKDLSAGRRAIYGREAGFFQASIAASLLVIARNSLPIDVAEEA